jgi:hypothetical protein
MNSQSYFRMYSSPGILMYCSGITWMPPKYRKRRQFIFLVVTLIVRSSTIVGSSNWP